MFDLKLTNGAMEKWCNGEIKIRIGGFFYHKYRICSFVLFFKHNIFTAEKEIHNLQFFITNNKYSKRVYIIKTRDHWKTGIYHGSSNSCEGYRESDLNRMASEILGNTLL